MLGFPLAKAHFGCNISLMLFPMLAFPQRKVDFDRKTALYVNSDASFCSKTDFDCKTSLLLFPILAFPQSKVDFDRKAALM